MSPARLHILGIVVIAVCAVVLGLVWYQRALAPEHRLPQTSISLVGPQGETISILAEIADDSAERSQGLMFRTSLDEGAGMLFVFSTPAEQTFWMKNTLIPLDILFFNSQKELVSFTSMEPCASDPCILYPSYGVASYALEVPVGFIQQHSVTREWRLEFPEEEK